MEAVFGYRVQHVLTMGPAKGGIRHHPEVDLGEVPVLAIWMTWKCALMRLPFGGVKGGVGVDPSVLSRHDLQRLTRRFTAEILPMIDPDREISAPDMGTNEQVMARLMDINSQQKGGRSPPWCPENRWFREDPRGATRRQRERWSTCLVEKPARPTGAELERATAVVQGFGGAETNGRNRGVGKAGVPEELESVVPHLRGGDHAPLPIQR